MKVKVKSLSHVHLKATPWTAAYQAPPSMGFSRQEYWSGVPLPSPHERVQIAKGLKNLWVSLPGISVVGVGQEDGISAPGGWPLLVPPPGWTVAYQAPPSMGFSRQEYWSGLPFPSPGDLPDPGIEARSPALQADSLPFEPAGKPVLCI